MSFILRRAARHASSLVAAASIVLLAAGCAVETPREVLHDHYVAGYVYHHPTGEVEASVRGLLEQRGFAVMPNDQGEAVRTEWRQLIGDEEFATVQERYFVVVHHLTKEHSRVTAVRIEYSTVGMETYHPTVPYHQDAEGRKVNQRSNEKGWRALQMGKPRVVRDIDLEWALIRRLDPQRARQLEATVDHAVVEGARHSP